MVLESSRLKTALMIFAIVLGNASPVHSVVGVLSAIAGVVLAGSSLAGTTLSGLAAAGYKVTVAVQVENWTRYALIYPTVRLKKGSVSLPPRAILPGQKEAFAVRKPSSTVNGVYGTASWEVAGANRRIVVMWSAPFNFDRYTNWMAVGLTDFNVTDVAPENTWFDIMYYAEEGCHDGLCFIRRSYYDIIDSIIYRNGSFEIEAMMTNVHKATVGVMVRPLVDNWDDVAPSLLEIPS